MIEKLDGPCDHWLVHMGQNFDINLSDVFFSKLNIRTPDYYIGVPGASFGEQIGQIIADAGYNLIPQITGYIHCIHSKDIKWLEYNHISDVWRQFITSCIVLKLDKVKFS